jgi:hypothetical protein
MRYQLLAVIALCLLQSSSAPPRVSILRATYYAFEDESVRVVVQVEPHPNNRLLYVMIVDGSEVVTSTLKQLDGEAAMRTWWISWSRLPAGDDMLIAATLFDSTGKAVARDTRRITVIARR